MPINDIHVAFLPDGTPQLEQAPASTVIGKDRAFLQQQIQERFQAGSHAWLLFLGFSDKRISLSPSLDFLRALAGLFVTRLTRTPDLEALRAQIDIPFSGADSQAFLLRAPLMTGSEYLNADLLQRLWRGFHQEYRQQIVSFDGSVAAFISTLSPEVHLAGRVFFHLVENKQGRNPFAFMATYSTDLNPAGQSKHVPLKLALREYEGRQEQLLDLLSTVYRAANDCTLIAELLASGDIFHPLAWSAGNAFRFLKTIPIYERAGILCRIPNWWKKKGARITLNVTFGNRGPSHVGMAEILNFESRLHLDGEPLSPAEARRLLEESEGLAFIKNRWVAVDAQKLEQTLQAYQEARKLNAREGISLQEALRLQLNPTRLLGPHAAEADVEISHGEWLSSVTAKLKSPARIGRVKPVNGFKALLRGYQQEGLNWLHFLHKLGFGACLADDMGLGKTVQVLAFLANLAAETRDLNQTPATPASLLVIPTSLIANWSEEIQRFAPCLKVLIAHPGAGETKNPEARYKNQLDRFDLVITTYGLVHRYQWLQAHRWRYLILDEAQAIKNPGTKQTRTLKTYQAANRLIMTGTPIENRLSDLWSLFDFLNPGLLGSKIEFKRFCKGLSEDRTGYKRLRQLIQPYILRRMKTDKKIISDLPDKIEMKTYATLSPQQVILYRQLVTQLEKTLEESEGIQRKGLVLSSLTKFKQICNHPGQYTGGGDFAEKRSGKFLRLREICEIIHDKREKVLVFTQFKEIMEPLCTFLETIFQRPGVFLHGGTPVKKRKTIIDRFQQVAHLPFMVLSLKAGGVGLNLTAANHVIHFDRWWNPAVENQATDRAFRIGQQKNVVVHKFLTRGTIEEKIDKMLEEKAGLSKDVIAVSGEAWITEMNNKDLVDLFTLSL